MEEIFGIVLRISVLYLYVLAILRLSGKRSIGDLGPLDFVVAILIGDLFDDVIWAEVPGSQGFVAVTVVVLLHTLMAYFSYRNLFFHNLVSSTKTELIHAGKFDRNGLRLERLHEETVFMELRLQGEDQIEEIAEGSLEPNGQLSVIQKQGAKTAQKKDLPRLEQLFR
jgi:uncharacterized membrane protein YcaP (DUF421 family)